MGFEGIFLGETIKYFGYLIVYIYFNYIKREKLTWKQIKEEKDNYGFSKYGVLAGFLGFFIFFALFLLLIWITKGGRL